MIAVAPSAPPLEVVLDETVPTTRETRGDGMPAALEQRYGGPLDIPLRPDRPTVVANFVATLDGVVALGTGALSGGGLISGFLEPDRFVMGLLRAVADVVVIGAGTVRGSTAKRWTPGQVQPALEPELRDWRAAMGLAPDPTTVIVSASGNVPLTHPGLNDPDVPVLVATTPQGAESLRSAGLPAHLEVEAIGRGGPLTGRDLIALAARRGARVVLSEGGPHLLAELVADDLLDELFLTVAPQIVGRSDERLGLVEGLALSPAEARWQRLVSIRRFGDHLFLRYRRGGSSPVQRES